MVIRSWKGANGSRSYGSFRPLRGICLFVVPDSGMPSGSAPDSWKPLSNVKNITRFGGVTLPSAAAATFSSSGASRSPPAPSETPLRNERRSLRYSNGFMIWSSVYLWVSGKSWMVQGS